MHHKHPFKLIFISLLLSSSIISCSATKIKQSVLMPANSNEMKNVKKLAVVGFTGDKKRLFSSKMESFFTNIRVKNERYFTVVDHATLVNNMREKNAAIAAAKTAAVAAAAIKTANTNSSATSSSNGTVAETNGSADGEDVGLIIEFKDPMEILGALLMAKASTNNPALSAIKQQTKKSGFSRNDAINLAKESGADTIITGTVSGPHTSSSPYKEERNSCAELKDKKCVKYTKIKISCVKQQGKIDFVMKAVDVNNGEITFSKAYSGLEESKHCVDTKYGKQTLEQLADAALKKAIARARNDVAPYTTIVTIELMEKDDSGMLDNADAKMLLKTGLSFAEKGHMRQACDNFRLASQSFGESSALFYNLGVCAEIKNDLDEASSLFTQAGNLSKKPHDLISTALTRVNDRREKNKQVAGQLR